MIDMLEGAPAYRPGVCNIGPAEIRRRRQIGWLGAIGAVLLAAALVLIGAPDIFRLSLALPVAAAISGFTQAQARFCAGFGLAGLQNFGRIGDQQAISDPEAQAADRRRALRMHATAALGGLVAGVAFFALPV